MASAAVLARPQPRQAATAWPQCRAFSTAQARPAPPKMGEVFTLDDIPFGLFQGVIARNGDTFDRLTPEQYYEVTQKFAQAVKLGADPLAMPIPGSKYILLISLFFTFNENSLCLEHTGG